MIGLEIGQVMPVLRMPDQMVGQRHGQTQHGRQSPEQTFVTGQRRHEFGPVIDGVEQPAESTRARSGSAERPTAASNVSSKGTSASPHRSSSRAADAASAKPARASHPPCSPTARSYPRCELAGVGQPPLGRSEGPATARRPPRRPERRAGRDRVRVDLGEPRPRHGTSAAIPPGGTARPTRWRLRGTPGARTCPSPPATSRRPGSVTASACRLGPGNGSCSPATSGSEAASAPPDIHDPHSRPGAAPTSTPPPQATASSCAPRHMPSVGTGRHRLRHQLASGGQPRALCRRRVPTWSHPAPAALRPATTAHPHPLWGEPPADRARRASARTGRSGGRARVRRRAVCSQHWQHAVPFVRGDLAPVVVPFGALVARGRTRTHARRGSRPPARTLHHPDGLVQRRGQRVDADGPAFTLGERPHVVFGARRQVVAVGNALRPAESSTA